MAKTPKTRKADKSRLCREFAEQRADFQGFTATLERLLNDLLQRENVPLYSIQGRTKSESSLAGKLSRDGKEYSALSEVTDLAGLRAITYFSNDVDRVCEIIRSNFEIDEANSIDKRQAVDPERFGYVSVHFVVTLGGSRIELPEYSRYRGLKAEIQIRSLLQHAWAEIEHDLGYKSRVAIPRHVRRQFSSLAGLLEIADREFVQIRQTLNEYEKEVKGKIESAPDEVGLDKVSYDTFFASDPFAIALDVELTATIGAHVDSRLSPNTNHLTELARHGIRTVAQLSAILARSKATLLRFAPLWVRGDLEGVRPGFSTFMLLYLLNGTSYDDAIAYVHRRRLYPFEGTKEQLAERIVQIVKQAQQGGT